MEKLLITLTLILLCSCSNDNNVDWGEVSYRTGNVDRVVKRSDVDAVYKGMVYEYGVSHIDVNIELAKKYYANINDKKLSAKRSFLLCYLYCTDELEHYYKKTKGMDHGVNIIYAIELTLAGDDCKLTIDTRACNYAERLIEEYPEDLYYNVGTSIYERLMGNPESYNDFELPYYLIMKSYQQGNEQAVNYLSQIPRHYSWVPRDT
jgi:hypothetical protein